MLFQRHLNAGDLVNDLVHQEISKLSSENWKSDFKIDDQISNVNPMLWAFIRSITRSARERHCKSNCNDADHVKKVRKLFIIAQLMFCTNIQKPAFIHTLLADTVEVCGGSRKLIRILNRLGVTSSPDTHDRFITEVVTEQRCKQVWDYIPKNTFTMATVDNYDMLQSHAAVYCGDQKRSFHATTLPKSCERV